MKKTVVTALIALFIVLAFASCDNIITEPGAEKSGAEKAEYTADGQKLVTVKVKVGGTAGNRALTDTLAKGAANYMEVIFKGGGRYYRAEALLSQTISIRIPAIKYNATNAILLIGKKTSTDYALLATGITNTDADTQNTIEFTIKSLTADLCAEGSPTFDIEEFSGSPDKIAEGNGRVFENKTKDGSFTDEITPCFQVPLNTTNIFAMLTISNFGGTEAIIKEVKKTSPVVKSEVTFNKEGTTTAEITANNINVTFLSNSCKIDFLFTTGGVDASYIITFDIPVVGFEVYAPESSPGVGDGVAPTLKDQIIWYIRGGTISSPTLKPQPVTGSGERGVALAVRSEPFKITDSFVGPFIPGDSDTDW